MTASPGLRVLVAEDSADQLVTLPTLLPEEGFNVAALHNAESILPTAAKFKPNVYLLDIGMPRCDGYQTAKKLRGIYGPSPLLIAVTAYATPADRERARNAGVDHHLPKPFDFRKLLALICGVRSAAGGSADDQTVDPRV